MSVRILNASPIGAAKAHVRGNLRDAPEAIPHDVILYSERRPVLRVTASEFPTRDVPAIEGIRNGDEAAFDALFRAFYPRLCSYVARLTRSPHVAEELVQEVFASIWERRRDWEPQGSVDQYLFRAAKNRALKYVRRQEVRSRVKGEIEAGSRDRPATPEELLVLDEISAAAQEAIDSLPDQRRHIFLLSREGALTYREIAELLNISVKTVETQMARALKAIRTVLLPYLR
jgi:RNA polymerase sigma-70 factor, ECF subfamily